MNTNQFIFRAPSGEYFITKVDGTNWNGITIHNGIEFLQPLKISTLRLISLINQIFYLLKLPIWDHMSGLFT